MKHSFTASSYFITIRKARILNNKMHQILRDKSVYRRQHVWGDKGDGLHAIQEHLTVFLNGASPFTWAHIPFSSLSECC